MNEFEEQRRLVRGSLAAHAGAARTQMRLSLCDAARLTCLTPEIMAAIENGSDRTSSLALMRHLALFLGLTELGLPRPRPAGME